MAAWRKASGMSDSEIVSELAELNAKWDDLRRDCDGGSGSPGEWIWERMNELEYELEQRSKLRWPPS